MAWSEAARRAAELARRLHRKGMLEVGSTVRFVGKGDPGDERLRMRLLDQDATRDFARVRTLSGHKDLIGRATQDVRRSELAPYGLPKEGTVAMYPGGAASRETAAAYLRAARRQAGAGAGRALRTRILAGRMMQAAMQKIRRR